MTKRAIAFLAVLIATLALATARAAVPQEAQSAGAIAGVVYDWQGSPVAAATVGVVPQVVADVLTESDGSFRLGGVPAGRYTLEAEAEALIAQSRTVDVRSGEALEVRLFLLPSEIALDQIEVTGGYSVNRSVPVPAVALTASEIRQLPHFGDDMFRALTYLPGLAGNDVSAQFHVRGGLYRDNMVRVDGVEIYEPYHLKDFQGVFSILDPGMIGAVNLLNGGFPSEHGDRLAGVLDLTTDRPNGPRQLDLGLSISSAWASGGGGFADGRGRWLGSVRRGWLDLVLEIAGDEEEEGEERRGDGPVYWDLLGKVDYDLTPSQSVSASVLASGDSLEEEELEEEDGIPTREIADTSYGNSYLWGSHQAVLGSRWVVSTVASAGQVDRDRKVAEEGFDIFSIRDERDTEVLALRQEWSFLPAPSHYLKWGFEVRSYDALYDYSSEVGSTDEILGTGEDRSFRGSFSGEHYALHLADRMRLTDRLTLEAGLRYDEQTLTDDDQFSPRLNLVWDLRRAGVLRAAWGHFFQSQRPYELQVEDGEMEFQPAERAEHYLIGWERPLRMWGDDYRLRVDAYLREVDDVRARWENLFRPFEPNPEVRRDRVQIAPESSEARGIELFLARRSGKKLDWWANYSLSEVTDRIEGRDTPRNIDQTHALNLNLSYRLGRKWTLGFVWTYHTGWPTTALDAELVELEDGTPQASPVVGPIYGENLSDYHRLDVRASRFFRRASGRTVELFIDVQNLYDRKNLAGYEVDERNFVILPGGDAAYLPSPEYWLGVVPSAGVRWRF